MRMANRSLARLTAAKRLTRVRAGESLMNRRLAVACAAAILCIASAPATQEYRNISLADYGRIVAGAIRFEPGEYAVVSRMASYDIKSLPNDSAEAKYVLGLMRQKLVSVASMSGKLCVAGAVGAG